MHPLFVSVRMSSQIRGYRQQTADQNKTIKQFIIQSLYYQNEEFTLGSVYPSAFFFSYFPNRLQQLPRVSKRFPGISFLAGKQTTMGTCETSCVSKLPFCRIRLLISWTCFWSRLGPCHFQQRVIQQQFPFQPWPYLHTTKWVQPWKHLLPDISGRHFSVYSRRSRNILRNNLKDNF